MNLRVAVIGQGYVGAPLSRRIASKGILCFGIDSDTRKVKQLKVDYLKSIKNKFNYSSKIDKYIPTSNYSVIQDCDVVIFCLPTPLNHKKKPDPQILENSIKKAKKFLKPNSLVIIESTVSTGFTRKISNKLTGIQVAFSPERIDPLNNKWDVKNTPKLVAGSTENVRDRAVDFYTKFIDTVIPVSSLEVAETAKLLENSFRLINISFINETYIFCEKLGIDIDEVIKAASSKPYGFMPFYPGVGVGGHCIPVDPIYLSQKAKEIGTPLKSVDLAAQINDDMPKYFIKKSNQILRNLKNKEILVLGVSYKPNISDVRESPVAKLIDGLRNKGAKVKWHDDIVKKWRGENSSDISDKYDLAIIAIPHDYFNLKKLGETKVIHTRRSI